MCVAKTQHVLVGLATSPPAVRRRIAVQPVRRTERCRRLFVQREPVIAVRPVIRTTTITIIIIIIIIIIFVMCVYLWDDRTQHHIEQKAMKYLLGNEQLVSVKVLRWMKSLSVEWLASEEKSHVCVVEVCSATHWQHIASCTMNERTKEWTNGVYFRHKLVGFQWRVLTSLIFRRKGNVLHVANWEAETARGGECAITVSYTHLTLPTKRIV